MIEWLEERTVIGAVSAGGTSPVFGNELAGQLGRDVVVGRSDKAAIVLSHVSLFSTCMAFEIEIRVPEEFASASVQEEVLAFLSRRRPVDGELDDERIILEFRGRSGQLSPRQGRG